jgi:tetratricopeptide (TPR) repeat protein
MLPSIRLCIVLGLFFCFGAYAQQEDNLTEEINIDELGNNEDEFQEVFFKAIAQRAVENPEKAIEELGKCLELQPDNVAVFYELAKNHLDLKNYETAEKFLIKTSKDLKYGSNENLHKQLFYVYSMQKKYDKAIEEALFISEFDPVYYQELANLYLLQNNYKSALEALDAYDAIEGIDEYRDDFRMIIYKEGSLLKQGITFFEKRFQTSNEDTRAGTLLMELHRLNNLPQKAIEVGKQLEKLSPNLPELSVEMALAHLVSQNISEAKTYSKKVVESLTLDEKDKIKVINTFKALALQNPEAQDAFISILDSALSSEKNSSSKAELGEFYKSRDKEKALENFKSALSNKPNDFKLIKNIVELELELRNFEDAQAASEKALDIFPSQAYFYFTKGYALAELDKHKEAVDVLEEALEYIFDDDMLKKKVYEVLKASYTALGNQEQAKAYEQKLIIISN